jgi:glycosyltransferase involved in cell wall biosynthesis
MDGVPVRYARFISPPRPLSYASWGSWAARSVRRALDRGPRPDIVHAHYAVPAGDAVLRWMQRGNAVPLVVSVHGGDLSFTAKRSERGRDVVTRVLRAADAVIANSEVTRRGIEELTGPLPFLEVIHPGADVPAATPDREPDPTLVTVAHLEPQWRRCASGNPRSATCWSGRDRTAVIWNGLHSGSECRTAWSSPARCRTPRRSRAWRAGGPM